MPGGIDPHTHMQLPTMGTVVADDFLSGTGAAAAGGTTTILDFVGPERGQSPVEALARWQAWAARCTVDYGFHMTVSWWGPGFAAEMAPLVRTHGVASFKFFLAYKGGLMLSDEQIVEGFLRCKELGALAQVHAENGELIAYLQAKLLAAGKTAPAAHALSRPPELEGEATLRAITMAETVDVPLYVVHVSAAQAADAIGGARRRGVKVVGETLPGFLAIDDSVYSSADFDQAAGHVMSPPYRPVGPPGGALEGHRVGRAQRHRNRSLLLHEGPEARRARAVHAHPERLRRGRGPAARALAPGRERGAAHPRAVRLAHLRERRPGLQPLAQEGLALRGRGRRRHRPRPREDEDALGPHAAPAD